ncbi:MAG: NUDIX domain-containing protein [Pseudomonadota bacterium]
MARPPYIDKLRRGVGSGLVMVPSACCVVRRADARVLLVRTRDEGWWTLPGGLIDPRESQSDAALRETWEETGLVVRLTQLIGVFGGPEFVHTYDNGDIINFYTTLFAAEPIDAAGLDALAPLDPEISELGWYTLGDAFNLHLKADARDYLRAARDNVTGAFPEPRWVPPESAQPTA